jgi:hypothetical protein
MNARDQRIADEVEIEADLRCIADRCPRRWSSDFGAKLCSAHAAAKSTHHWPRITQDLIDLETQQALRGPRPRPQRYATREEGIAALEKLRHMGRGDPRRWAKVLQRREERGVQLTKFQRVAWREVVRDVEPQPEVV